MVLEGAVEGGKQTRRLREGLNQPGTSLVSISKLKLIDRATTATGRRSGADKRQLGELGDGGQSVGILPLDTGRGHTLCRVLEQGSTSGSDVEIHLSELVTNVEEGERLVEVGGSDQNRLPPREGVANLGQTVLETKLVHLVGELNVLSQRPNTNVGAADGDSGTNDGVSVSAHFFILLVVSC